MLTPARVTRRRMAVLTFVVFVTGAASLVMADLLWGTPFARWGFAVWLLFTLLFGLVAFGAAHAFLGFMVRSRAHGDSCAITRSLEPGEESSIPLARTALVFPIYNEDTTRICAGVLALYRSIERTGKLDHFDFFILSDSTSPDRWVAEEVGWARLVARLGAAGRLFYRRRRINSNKKAGNIADFCRRWGRRYRYMVVLDADSVMSGQTVVSLVRLMERNPGAGLIQTAPSLVRAKSLFARTLQFAFRLYGPIFQAGLSYWQLGEGNYWGHNAIIRVAPFIEHCALPRLPGREPFGGRILSHDFVEAALLRRAGWSVWLAGDLGGSHEEPPPTLIDFAQRDRRWSQGNLQHSWVLFARGLHGISRVHLFLGIFAYTSSLLWLSSLLLGTLLAIGFARTGLTWLPDPGLAAVLGITPHLQAAALALFTFSMLFVAKFLAVLDLRRHRGTQAFGSPGRLWLSMLIESVTSCLLAPILMLFHVRFVLSTIFGRGVHWVSQRRSGFTSWSEALATHAVHTAVGITWAVALAIFAPSLLPWMAPVLAGLVLSIPFSQITSRESLGELAARHGLLMTPEELAPSRELRDVAAAEAEADWVVAAGGARAGFVTAITDPWINALHRSLLRDRARQPDPVRQHFHDLQEKALRDGVDALTRAEQIALLSDPASVDRLHREVWLRGAERLAPSWREALSTHHDGGKPQPAAAAVPENSTVERSQSFSFS